MNQRFTARLTVAFTALSIAVATGLSLPAHAGVDPRKSKAETKADKPAALPKVSAKDILEVKKAAEPAIKDAQDTFSPKDPKNPGKLHEKADLFEKGKLPEGLTTDMVLAALSTQMASDPKVDAYAKWQLLSGLPSPFPEEMLGRAIDAYRAAPRPIAHPGLDHAGFQAILQKVGTQNRKAAEPVNAELEKAIAVYETNDEPIIQYRNELKSRLPVTGLTLAAQLEDLYTRIIASTESKPMWDKVREQLKLWSITAKPQEISYLIPGVEKVLSSVKDDKNKAYYRVIWLEDTKYKGLKFDARGAFDPKGYDTLVTDMKDAARGSIGPAGAATPKMETSKK